MKKEIYDVKDKLYYESVLLRQEASKEPEYNKSMNLRKKQDDLYKKWIFYKNIIEANNKIDKNT